MRKRIQFQLYELGSVGAMAKKLISSSGGVVYVAAENDPSKVAITDKDGATLSNPRALTNGACEFHVDTSVSKVDLFIQCPDGQFVVARGVDETVQDIGVDVGQMHQCMVIPFAQADFTANTETDTGFDEPLSGKAMMLPNPAIRVTTADATETLDVGTDGAVTNDPNGFLAAVSLGTPGLVKGSLANGVLTLGALLFVQDSANAGDEAPEGHLSTGENITITTSAGSDTGEGYIYLPYLLLN